MDPETSGAVITYLLGVGSVMVAALVIGLIADKQFRESALEVLAAMVMLPVLLPLAVTRRGPRCKRISVVALERFCRQVDRDMQPAWLLSYGGRGVIFVRRSSPGGWRNNVPNRATDATGGVSARSSRSEPIKVQDPGQ